LEAEADVKTEDGVKAETGDVKKVKRESGVKKEQGTKREHSQMTLARPSVHTGFVVPRPGRDGALANSLAGKTFVLTGLFPEVGGGAGLSLGKERVKSMIADFGGRVTSAISGKTDYLVVGKEPGRSKVGKARDKDNVELVEIGDIQGMVRGNMIGERGELVIDDFSAGWHGNALRLTAAEEEYVSGGVKRVGGGKKGKC
jgi:NAD-dependent DNA ligase